MKRHYAFFVSVGSLSWVINRLLWIRERHLLNVACQRFLSSHYDATALGDDLLWPVARVDIRDSNMAAAHGSTKIMLLVSKSTSGSFPYDHSTLADFSWDGTNTNKYVLTNEQAAAIPGEGRRSEFVEPRWNFSTLY